MTRLRYLLALIVAGISAIVWYGAGAPMDDDELARRFRESEGRVL